MDSGVPIRTNCGVSAYRCDMIEFFTVLILTYHIQGEAHHTTVIYDTEDRCQEAMDRGVMLPLYDQLYDLYGNDMMLRCYVTEEISKYPIRPRLKPSIGQMPEPKEENN